MWPLTQYRHVDWSTLVRISLVASGNRKHLVKHAGRPSRRRSTSVWQRTSEQDRRSFITVGYYFITFARHGARLSLCGAAERRPERLELDGAWVWGGGGDGTGKLGSVGRRQTIVVRCGRQHLSIIFYPRAVCVLRRRRSKLIYDAWLEWTPRSGRRRRALPATTRSVSVGPPSGLPVLRILHPRPISQSNLRQHWPKRLYSPEVSWTHLPVSYL